MQIKTISSSSLSLCFELITPPLDKLLNSSANLIELHSPTSLLADVSIDKNKSKRTITPHIIKYIYIHSFKGVVMQLNLNTDDVPIDP